MNVKGGVKGAMIASAVAGLFASACATPSAAVSDGKMEKTAAAMVHCGGVNGCKGQAECAGPDNSCKGQNSCKGKGWMSMATEKECTDKGGTLQAYNEARGINK